MNAIERTTMSQSTEKTFGSDMNLPVIVTIGVVGAVLIFVMVFGIQAWFFAQQREEMATKSLARQNPALVDNRMRQLTNLDGYRWVDQKAGVVAIPIDRAMELTVNDYAARPAPTP